MTRVVPTMQGKQPCPKDNLGGARYCCSFLCRKQIACFYAKIAPGLAGPLPSICPSDLSTFSVGLLYGSIHVFCSGSRVCLQHWHYSRLPPTQSGVTQQLCLEEVHGFSARQLRAACGGHRGKVCNGMTHGHCAGASWNPGGERQHQVNAMLHAKSGSSGSLLRCQPGCQIGQLRLQCPYLHPQSPDLLIQLTVLHASKL